MRPSLRYLRRSAAGFLAAVLLLAGGTAAAQQNRSLRVTDGEVYIDGRLVPPDELPPGLEVRDMTVNYTFSGDVSPVIQLGDNFFVLDGDQLRAAEQEERDVHPFFRAPSPPDVPDVHVEFRDGFPDVPPPPEEPYTVVFERKAEEMREQAERIQELQRHLQEEARTAQDRQERVQLGRAREFQELARQMSLQAAEAARMASDLPRLEVETYLQDVQRMNESLFDQLVNETELERRTLEMAAEIREMEEGSHRRERVDALREQLDEIFELKQQNRQTEVDQLEEQLEALQERLAAREALREEIVERRLRQLLREDEMRW